MSKALKVLFAVDFKEGCKLAMSELMQIARYRPMEITLLHVFNDHYYEEREFLFPDAIEKMTKAKAEIRKRLEDKLDDWAVEVMGPSFYQARVEFGNPAEVFAKYSKQFDLLVLGANRHSFIDRVFLNSVAESILGRTHMPTMILRQQNKPSHEATVLVDMADDIKDYIGKVLSWAEGMRISSLKFISYYPVPIEVSAYAMHSAVVMPDGEIKKMLSELQGVLEKTIQEFETDLLFEVVAKRVPASSLPSNIAEDLANLTHPIVLGRRYRSALSEFFLGSVALSVLRGTKCDIAILPLED